MSIKSPNDNDHHWNNLRLRVGSLNISIWNFGNRDVTANSFWIALGTPSSFSPANPQEKQQPGWDCLRWLPPWPVRRLNKFSNLLSIQTVQLKENYLSIVPISKNYFGCLLSFSERRKRVSFNRHATSSRFRPRNTGERWLTPPVIPIWTV